MGSGERESTEALWPPTQTAKPRHPKIVKRITLLSPAFRQRQIFHFVQSWRFLCNLISLKRYRCQNHKISQARAHETVARIPPMAAISFFNMPKHGHPSPPSIHPHLITSKDGTLTTL